MKQTLTTGTRSSPLALKQAAAAALSLETSFPGLRFEITRLSSPGDRDKHTALPESAADFFTRDLDDALIRGDIDCAVHSAKDLPETVRPEIDWFWLPNPEDPRDVLLFRDGADPHSPGAVFGNSSARREAFIRKFYPQAVIKPLRGTIEERIAKLDAGEYDVLIMAAAALNRLGLQHRISQWIATEDLEAPEGQGCLAVTFRKGDGRFIAMRNLFTKAVCFVSAGAGEAGLCTAAGIEALQHCDVCLYDALMPHGLLDRLPSSARAVYVGKRSGKHSLDQQQISRQIADCARQGKRVVRLKGGDAGLFGRLAEETGLLEDLQIPFTVLPGVTSLSAATTGTGLLLTRRGASRGFSVFTTARAKNSIEPLIPSAESFSCAVYMGISSIGELAATLPAATPVCVIFNAGMADEEIVGGTADSITARIRPDETRPGIILYGPAADTTRLYKKHGILAGRKVWLTCSEALQPEAARLVRDFGGRPVRMPLIRLSPTRDPLPDLSGYDWLVLTSPSAVDCLMGRTSDVRRLPKILACGPGSERALLRYKVKADALPGEDFSTEGILKTAFEQIPAGARILRMRSDAAGPLLLERLNERFIADDFIIGRNEPVLYETPPACDAIFLASPSACDSLIRQFGPGPLQSSEIIAIGSKTAARLRESGVTDALVATRSTVPDALREWATRLTLQKLETEITP